MATASTPRSWAKVVAGDEKTEPVAKSESMYDVEIAFMRFPYTKQTTIYNCRRVPVPGTDYFKYITHDGQVLVVIGFYRWSTDVDVNGCQDPDEKQHLKDLQFRLLVDSKIIDYIASPEYNELRTNEGQFKDYKFDKYEYSKTKMMEILGLPVVDQLPNAYVHLPDIYIRTVPIGARFCVTSNWEHEHLQIFEEETYHTA
jgi:hypothetical protein